MYQVGSPGSGSGWNSATNLRLLSRPTLSFLSGWSEVTVQGWHGGAAPENSLGPCSSVMWASTPGTVHGQGGFSIPAPDILLPSQPGERENKWGPTGSKHEVFFHGTSLEAASPLPPLWPFNFIHVSKLKAINLELSILWELQPKLVRKITDPKLRSKIYIYIFLVTDFWVSAVTWSDHVQVTPKPQSHLCRCFWTWLPCPASEYSLLWADGPSWASSFLMLLVHEPFFVQTGKSNVLGEPLKGSTHCLQSFQHGSLHCSPRVENRSREDK